MRFLAVLLLSTLLAGCSFKVPGYSVKGQNVDLIEGGNKQFSISKETPGFDDDGMIPCRAAGTVSLPGSGGFSGYIASALESELRAAGLYDKDSDQKIRMKLNSVDFSSAMGASNWRIEGDYEIGGNTIHVSTVHNDRSSFLAVKACNNMAVYFRKAVSVHLAQLYRDPLFKKAIGYVEPSKTPAPKDIEERLNKLKDLHKKGLLTEEEYSRKRTQIIDSF